MLQVGGLLMNCALTICALQFGHLFAKGETREAAIRSMVVALKEVKIRGEIRTIVDYAVEMIQSPDFLGNNIHTGWLDSRIASHVRQ
jgi:acetyl-CoA carboxylase/biotin carboxylase 1